MQREGSLCFRKEKCVSETTFDRRLIQIPAGAVYLEGILSLPDQARGMVIFVHGSDRNGPRNRFVADLLNAAGLATLLFDLLTPEEQQQDSQTGQFGFDVELSTRRTVEVAHWLAEQPDGRSFKIGLFGSSTGAAAALNAAARQPELIRAVVSRGGRPDLASAALPEIHSPTLLIVGERDLTVLDRNRIAIRRMNPWVEKKLVVIPNATHLFEEPGALEQAGHLALGWFEKHLSLHIKGKSTDENNLG
jgi:dienelactone hydrolase